MQYCEWAKHQNKNLVMQQSRNCLVKLFVLCIICTLFFGIILAWIVAEENASELVNELLEMSEKARRTEALLDQMEKERFS